MLFALSATAVKIARPTPESTAALARHALARYAHRQTRLQWERRWARPEFGAGWAEGPVPAELHQAVEEGWFPPGGAVLDIGCGDGRLARWLAERGFDVLGIDFSAAAVARATAAQAEADGRPSFATMDICRARPRRMFDALLDRGTLQLVEPGLLHAYIRNSAAVLSPGGRFLLLYPTATRRKEFRGEQEKSERLLTRLVPAFESLFEIKRVSGTVFGEDREGQPYAHGLAFWFVRR